MIHCVIVDDEPWALDLLKSYMLSDENLALGLATQKPIEALNYIKSNPVDLIFLDIQMPEMTGLPQLRRKIEVSFIQVPLCHLSQLQHLTGALLL